MHCIASVLSCGTTSMRKKKKDRRGWLLKVSSSKLISDGGYQYLIDQKCIFELVLLDFYLLQFSIAAYQDCFTFPFPFPFLVNGIIFLKT